MHPRKFVRDSVSFAVSQYLARAALMARGVIAASLVGPTSYGAWNALMLVLEYSSLSQLGTQQGLDQLVPQRIVEGDAARLERIKRGGLFNVLLLGLLAFPVVALAFRFTGGQILAFWGAGGVALVLLCMLLGHLLNYHGSLLRSHGDIGAVAWGLSLQSVIGALAGIGLIPWLGVWGLLWGWFGGTLVGLGYSRWRSRGRVPLQAAPSAESRTLLRVGFPIFLFTGTTFVMRSLDRVLVLRFLGTTQLGYYTLAIMALTFMLYASDSVSYVLYPRLVRRFRESGGEAAALRELIVPPLRALSLFMPWLTGLVYLAADELVGLVLPRFGPGEGALRILAFGAAGLTLGSIPAFTLITLGRMRQLFAVAAGGTLLLAALDVAAIFRGWGIRGVAATTLAGYLTYGGLLLWLALGLVHGPRRGRAGLVLRLVLPLGAAVGIGYAVEHGVPGVGRLGWAGLWRLAATATLFSALYAAAMAPLARGIGLRDLLAQFRLRGLGASLSGAGGK